MAGGGADGRGEDPAPAPTTETVESSFTVSACPKGQGAGAPESAIGRFSSKVCSQSRQRYSYLGTVPV